MCATRIRSVLMSWYNFCRVTMPHCWPMGRPAQERVTQWWAMGLTKVWFLNCVTGCLRPFGKMWRRDNVRWGVHVNVFINLLQDQYVHPLCIVSTQVFFSMLEIYNEQVTEGHIMLPVPPFPAFTAYHVHFLSLPSLFRWLICCVGALVPQGD